MSTEDARSSVSGSADEAEQHRPLSLRGHYALGNPAIGPRPLARTRSFTRRGGRMPHTHQRAWDRLSDAVVLSVPLAAGDTSTVVDPGYRLDPADVFGRRAPLVVEVGSGAGDALVAGAVAHPERDFLALEVWRPGTGHALAKMAAANHGKALPNVRVVEVDAALALRTMLEPGTVEEVWTFFPDPWPKVRHHKRRLVGPEFADAVADVLRPGGRWRLSTDWDDYAAVMRDVVAAEPRFRLASTERFPLRPVTRFERRGTEAGRRITDLAYVRTG